MMKLRKTWLQNPILINKASYPVKKTFLGSTYNVPFIFQQIGHEIEVNKLLSLLSCSFA